jgi:methylmalonyl-CoA mutase
MSEDGSPAFAAEFPKATREQWLALVADVLRGAPFERRLVSKTYDGLAIEPLYGRDAAARPVFGHAAGTPWQVLQRIDHPDPAAANAQALTDLGNGATGLSLIFAGAVGARGFGLPNSGDAIAAVLDGASLGIALDIHVGWPARAVFDRLDGLRRRRGTAPQAADFRFGFDPLGALATGASASPAWQEIAPEFAALVRAVAQAGYRGPAAVADARVINDAGGSEAQEIAYALAVAVAYLRAIEASGLGLGDARSMIAFRVAAGTDQFLTMAKLRALRRLWARIEEACRLAGRPVFIAAESAWRMMTQRDPAVNMLRTTMAVAAAGLGGADAITVLPHTAAIGLPDEFARRIARNTQLILLEEANLAKVADPAAGAGAVEALTHALAVAAWELFREIEQAGGAAAALEQGLIQGKVAAVRSEREKAIARGRDALTGTSAFPNLAEAPPSPPPGGAVSPAPGRGRSAREANQVGVGGGSANMEHAKFSESQHHPTPDRLRRSDPSPPGEGEASFPPLPPIRLAEPFEKLRDASDRALARTGARPKIFLANLGRPADFSARATYAGNCFAAGGIEAVTNDGFADREAMIAAFKASAAALACLCAADTVYAGEAADTAKALRAAGAKHIYLAGRPGEHEAAFRAAGIDTFIHAGCDMLAILRAAHAKLGL